MLAEATEHGYLVVCNGQVIAFRYGGSTEETRFVRQKPVAQVLQELSSAGWRLCRDKQESKSGSGDYEVCLERGTVRADVGVPDEEHEPAAVGSLNYDL